jgi:MFS family permease
VSSIFRGTILQTVVPDHLRGRLNAINIMFVLGGPQLGQFESGAVAALWSPVASVVTGGVACVASVFAVAAWIPEITRFRAHRDELATPS